MKNPQSRFPQRARNPLPLILSAILFVLGGGCSGRVQEEALSTQPDAPGSAGADAQGSTVVLNPNTIRGHIRFANTNP